MFLSFLAQDGHDSEVVHDFRLACHHTVTDIVSLCKYLLCLNTRYVAYFFYYYYYYYYYYYCYCYYYYSSIVIMIIIITIIIYLSVYVFKFLLFFYITKKYLKSRKHSANCLV